MFSDEKTFYLSVSRHRQNDGLWISADNPTPEELELVQDRSGRHSPSISAWGAVSWDGRSELHLFDTTMDAKYYTEMILAQFAKLFMNGLPKTATFVQDDDKKHISNLATKWLDENFGTRWTRPPPPPCKEQGKYGTFQTQPKRDKNGKV